MRLADSVKSVSYVVGTIGGYSLVCYTHEDGLVSVSADIYDNGYIELTITFDSGKTINTRLRDKDLLSPIDIVYSNKLEQ